MSNSQDSGESRDPFKDLEELETFSREIREELRRLMLLKIQHKKTKTQAPYLDRSMEELWDLSKMVQDVISDVLAEAESPNSWDTSEEYRSDWQESWEDVAQSDDDDNRGNGS